MNRALFISVLIHSCLLLSLATNSGGGIGKKPGNENGKGNSTTNISIIPKDPIKPTYSGHKSDRNGMEIKMIPTTKVKKPCLKTYGGIGIEMKSLYNDGIVDRVFRGYPADRAGLLPGDSIYTLNGEDVKGEPGTIIHIVVVRDGQQFHKMIMREKICYEDRT